MRRFWILPLLLLLAIPAWAQMTHPFSIHDMLAMERISGLAASPDGKWVAFELRSTDLDANKGRYDLWMVGVDGKGLRRLTTDPAADTGPVWSPDGRSLFFLSSRSGSQQVWQLPLDGGEARQITELPLDVEAMRLSPDGSMLAVCLKVFVDADTPCATADRLKEIEERSYSGRVYDQLFIRHWDTWKDGRRNHVWVMPVEGGKPVDVMKGMVADSPTIPWGGAEEFSFTPDGRGIVFVAKEGGTSEVWSTDHDLYYAPIDGSAPPRCLTTANEAWDTLPVFSPDGKRLAYLAMARPGYEADRYRIVLRDWNAADGTLGIIKGVAEDWDRSPRSLVWSADGKTLYTHADNLGQRSVFEIDVKKGEVKVLQETGTVRDLVLAGKLLVFGLESLTSPTEIHTLQTNGKNLRRITGINDERVAAARMGEPEQFSFKGWNDETVYGYVVKPVDFMSTRKYPVAFLIHGGPQGSFGNDFHYRWNPQAYTGAGYAVVMIDFHGSTGYGQDFCDAIRGDWGGKPLEDLQKGLAAALERYPWMNGENVAALGASYGGYMVNWIAGNWPDRFACLVSHDGNLDERMAYFDTEELWFPEWDHMGTPWTNPEGYEKQNPANFVQNWKTPMLIIHGALDYRVVETQGMSAFTACQRLGIPSRFLYFPDENHWVLKPHNSIQWHETVLGWMDQWTK